MRTVAPANNANRTRLKDYLKQCGRHGLRHWKPYVLPLVVVLFLQLFIRIDINYTDSLPGRVFITVKGWKTGMQRGDYLAYRFPTEDPSSPYRKGDHMVKIVGGIPGDLVRRNANGAFEVIDKDADEKVTVTLGGQSMGLAKTTSRTGKPLKPGPEGRIPEGAYYVFAPHKDSLDSRYAMVGWITAEHIIGRTFPLF